MEETAPLRLLAQEGLPPPVQDGECLANGTGSVKKDGQMITGSVTKTVSIQTGTCCRGNGYVGVFMNSLWLLDSVG